MSIGIEYLYEVDFNFSTSDEERMSQLLNHAAMIEGRTQGELSITFCNNDRIQELNHNYRGINRPTDVLSFPMDDEELLGDIIISIPKAEDQAREYGHSFERELFFLSLHGFLHLLGYDHETPEEEKVMIAKQELVLSEMGIVR